MAARIQELIKTHKEMTHAVSHELQTPLACMKFALEMAQKNYNKEKIQKQISSIHSDVTKMNTLVNNLLHYASLEELNNQSLVCQQGDMSYLIQQLTERAARSKPEKLTFILQDNTTDGQVECDWHRMERAIFNLLQNATRFARHKIAIHLSSGTDEYQIVIDDDGPACQMLSKSIFSIHLRLNTKSITQTGCFGLVSSSSKE